MGKYLKKFSTDPERVEYEDSNDYLEPYVSYVGGDNTVHYNKSSDGGDTPAKTPKYWAFNFTGSGSPLIAGSMLEDDAGIVNVKIYSVENDDTKASVFDTSGKRINQQPPSIDPFLKNNLTNALEDETGKTIGEIGTSPTPVAMNEVLTNWDEYIKV